jgi:Trk-type K+ transport system membrane component
MGFVTDGWISVTICLAIIAGGLGFPVWFELFRRTELRRWTLHTKLTLLVTALLLVVGTVAILGFEWSNDGTLGPLSVPGKLLAAFFQGVQPRTAGFNSVDYGQMELESLLVSDVLMFIGTGSAATGGGIKVTTFALLALMVWAEIRGDPNVNAFGRRIPIQAQRQAFAVATSDFTLSQTLFEAASAFGTVGLSTGITDDLNAFGQWVLIVLMYLGRVGPHTLGVALVLRERERRYQFSEERPIIG